MVSYNDECFDQRIDYELDTTIYFSESQVTNIYSFFKFNVLHVIQEMCTPKHG
jgi:hypothetical protein